jgi:dihydropteroate synthase
MKWQIRDRKLELDRPLLMAILNLTPDSFSDGGLINGVDGALRAAEKSIRDGADILDIGGESSRPGSRAVSVEEEIRRVIPAIEAITARFDIPISVDTYKSAVAKAALEAGANIINDISAFRFDIELASVVAAAKAGVVLMHSRGTFDSLHSTEFAQDIFEDVSADLRRALAAAEDASIDGDSIALDIGIGFGKSFDQNLALINGLGRFKREFPKFPLVIGASRKSFLGKVLKEAPVNDRLEGSLASAAIAVYNGVSIVRAHDVKETSAVLKMVDAICKSS